MSIPLVEETDALGRALRVRDCKSKLGQHAYFDFMCLSVPATAAVHSFSKRAGRFILLFFPSSRQYISEGLHYSTKTVNSAWIGDIGQMIVAWKAVGIDEDSVHLLPNV